VSVSRSLRIVFRNRRVCLLFVAGAVRFIGGFALGSFLAKYFEAAYPDNNSDYAVINGFVIGFGGTASSTLGGLAADALAVRYGQKVVCRSRCLPAVSCRGV
jgi:predicted MFS family arabinose efflux permease